MYMCEHKTAMKKKCDSFLDYTLNSCSKIENRIVYTYF